MLMLGFLLAVLLASRRSRALGLERAGVFDLGFFAIIGGIIGARLLHVLLNLGFYFAWPAGTGFFRWVGASLLRVVATWNGGLVFYGGLAGGVGAMWLYARRKNIPFTDALDFASAPAALGLAVTRVGCFLNGCCFGKKTLLPWGVKFPAGSYAYAVHDEAGRLIAHREPFAVHPTQLYELAAALAMFGLLWVLYRRRKFSGQIAWSFGLLYASWRFFNEFFRADSGPWRPCLLGRSFDPGPLTVFQYMSIVLFAVFAVLLAAAWRRRREPFAPLPEVTRRPR